VRPPSTVFQREEFRPHSSAGAQMRAKEWDLYTESAGGSASRHRIRPRMLDVIVLCATGVVVLGAVLLHLGPLTDSARSIATERDPPSVPAIPASSNSDSKLPRSDPPVRQVDPKAAVLSARDMPGYKLISSAQALRPGGGTVPNSWDNVMQKSKPGAPDYRLTEAIILVYGTIDDAVAGAELRRQNQESQGIEVSPGLVGIQSVTWADRTSVPGYSLLHAVFRIEQVVAEVTVLAKDNPVLIDELQVLAATQQVRLVALLHGRA